MDMYPSTQTDTVTVGKICLYQLNEAIKNLWPNTLRVKRRRGCVVLPPREWYRSHFKPMNFRIHTVAARTSALSHIRVSALIITSQKGCKSFLSEVI